MKPRHRHVTDTGEEVSEEECQEGEEGRRQDGPGQEGGDVHLSAREADQAPPALSREAPGRDRSLLSAAGQYQYQ